MPERKRGAQRADISSLFLRLRREHQRHRQQLRCADVRRRNGQYDHSVRVGLWLQLLLSGEDEQRRAACTPAMLAFAHSARSINSASTVLLMSFSTTVALTLELAGVLERSETFR